MLLLTTAGEQPGGGLLSSSVPIIVVLGLVAIVLAHKPIASWLSSRHDRVHEHFYGPSELHADAPAAPQEAPENAPAPQGGQPDPNDGFDYDIYS